MAAGPKTTTWYADPHTIAKIKILQAYLVAYFQILGRTRRGQKLLCVDGFAGPDQYVNHSHGSPTAALNAARTALNNSQSNWLAGEIHFAFVELEKDRYETLLKQLPGSNSVLGVQIHTYNMEFTEALPQIKRDIPEPFHSDYPLFVFIDPFGATGAPFKSVADILNSPCSEVLINFDADGISRNFAAKQATVLNDVFGDDSWQGRLQEDQSFDAKCRVALQLYKERLRGLSGVRYIFEVEMQGSSGNLNYFLLFASKHPLGLMKMKEAMKKIAQNGTYRFSDADVGQTALFRFDAPEVYHMKLYENFKGQTVPYDSKSDDVTAYALNDTPFTDAKSMLILLERENMIKAISSDAKRKRGTFNHSVKAINFHGRIENGVLF